jgi:hypothetical protein
MRSAQVSAAGFGTLIDVVADPPRGFRALDGRSNTLAALVALVVLVLAGAWIQAPVVARANVEQLQKAFAQGHGAGLSGEQRDAMVAQAANPPVAAQLVNPAIYLVLIGAGVLAESGLAAVIVMFAGGAPRFGKLSVAFLNVAVWCIGLYYLASSVIIRVGFVTENSDAVFPSVLTAAGGVTDLFVRGALASLNIFLVFAFVLHAIGLREIAQLRSARPYVVAGTLAVAEIVASGVISKVLG